MIFRETCWFWGDATESFRSHLRFFIQRIEWSTFFRMKQLLNCYTLRHNKRLINHLDSKSKLDWGNKLAVWCLFYYMMLSLIWQCHSRLSDSLSGTLRLLNSCHSSFNSHNVNNHHAGVTTSFHFTNLTDGTGVLILHDLSAACVTGAHFHLPGMFPSFWISPDLPTTHSLISFGVYVPFTQPLDFGVLKDQSWMLCSCHIKFTPYETSFKYGFSYCLYA